MKQKTDQEYHNIKNVFITEEKLHRFYELTEALHQMEKEIEQLKQEFHQYFDHHAGEGMKGEVLIGPYKLQRQVRVSENYDDLKTVQILEELNMVDCIKISKKADKVKVNAALSLGLIKESDLEGCLVKKGVLAISLKKVN